MTKDNSFATNVSAESQLINAVADSSSFKQKLELAKIEVDSIGDTLGKKVDNLVRGDKSQDISTPETRSLNEVKEATISVQNAEQIKTIVNKDIRKEEVQQELGLKIQKYNPDDSTLPQNVKDRILELREKKQEEIYAFYDEKTGNIFVNENIPEEELRPSIAREWKIQQDLKDGKGKLTEEAKKHPEISKVYLDESLDKIFPEIFGKNKTRPDVVIKYKDGSFNVIEVRSSTDNFNLLEKKLTNLQYKYGNNIIVDWLVIETKMGE